MKLYRIKDWHEHFENARSNERDKLSWCAVPNKQDGLGYGLLMSMQNGPALYGAFVAVVLMASKQKRPRTGLLTASGLPADFPPTASGLPGNYPLTARHMAVKTKMPERLIEEMLAATTDSSIGWIEVVTDYPPTARQLPADCPPTAQEGKGMEGKEGEGEKGTPPARSEVSETQFPEIALPTVGEVIALGSMRNVPAAYCEHYHAICTERHRWLVNAPTGQKLIVWQSELPRWWARDRHNWTPEGERQPGQQPGASASAPHRPSLADIA